MDVAYTINIVKTTKIPNLGAGDDNGEIKNHSMHAKYNEMHESRMMEEAAVMLSFVATSMIHLTKKPATGKYSSVFNSTGRLAFIVLFDIIIIIIIMIIYFYK
jgi:hypothetical protein